MGDEEPQVPERQDTKRLKRQRKFLMGCQKPLAAAVRAQSAPLRVLETELTFSQKKGPRSSSTRLRKSPACL
jgi:hypothetical protein